MFWYAFVGTVVVLALLGGVWYSTEKGWISWGWMRMGRPSLSGAKKFLPKFSTLAILLAVAGVLFVFWPVIQVGIVAWQSANDKLTRVRAGTEGLMPVEMQRALALAAPGGSARFPVVKYSDGASVRPFDGTVRAEILPSDTPEWAFAGYLPLGSFVVDASAECQVSGAEMFLLDYWMCEGKPKVIDELRETDANFKQVLKKDPRAVSGSRSIGMQSYKNQLRGHNTTSPSELYIQCSETSRMCKINCMFSVLDSGAGAEIIEIGRNDVTLTMADEGWVSVCIIPIHDRQHRADVGGTSVTCAGLDELMLVDAMKRYLIQGGRSDVKSLAAQELSAKHYYSVRPVSSEQYLALMLDKVALQETKVLSFNQHKGKSFTLRLNGPATDGATTLTRPAQVLVTWRRS
ncbi:MAG: hypothetical protein HYZ63_03870 [Candidatus Andersenbacteria bacterium]|nr:hypothetical protein [Candidatus Andersenbacteria bacterium]